MENPFLKNLVDTTGDSVTKLWGQVIEFIPTLIGAILILLIGLIVAWLLEKLVERVVYYLRLDSVLKKAELESYFERANIRLNIGVFFGKIVYWFVILGSFITIGKLLGFTAFNEFLDNVINVFIPGLIVAVLIMLVAMVVANFLRQLVAAGIASAKMNHAKGLGALTWWAVVILGFLTALQQIGIDTKLIDTIILYMVQALTLGAGLAFGLGGKEHAARFLSKWGEEMKK